MAQIQHQKITIETNGQAFYDITKNVQSLVAELTDKNAIALIYCMHTSASICIQEAFDPSAKADMEEFLARLAPENQKWHRHIEEGPDDTTSHLKALLTGNQVVLPVEQGKIVKGTWQGIYLCEHRKARHSRTVLLSLII